jgi:hypothetical protein
MSFPKKGKDSMARRGMALPMAPFFPTLDRLAKPDFGALRPTEEQQVTELLLCNYLATFEQQSLWSQEK